MLEPIARRLQGFLQAVMLVRGPSGVAQPAHAPFGRHSPARPATPRGRSPSPPGGPRSRWGGASSGGPGEHETLVPDLLEEGQCPGAVGPDPLPFRQPGLALPGRRPGAPPPATRSPRGTRPGDTPESQTKIRGAAGSPSPPGSPTARPASRPRSGSRPHPGCTRGSHPAGGAGW